MGSRGHPGSGKIELFRKSKFSPFPSQICPTKRARRRARRFFATPKPVSGGPCGQPSAWMPPTVSQDTTQSLWDPTLGSLGHPGSGKTPKIANFTRFGAPKKTQVPGNAQTPKIAKKLKFRQNEAVSSKLFNLDPPTNQLRLAGEQKKIRFPIDGPEIWPAQKWILAMHNNPCFPYFPTVLTHFGPFY